MCGLGSTLQDLRGRRPLKWAARCLMQAVVLLFLTFGAVLPEHREGIALEALSEAPGTVHSMPVEEGPQRQRVSWPIDLTGPCLLGEGTQKCYFAWWHDIYLCFFFEKDMYVSILFSTTICTHVHVHCIYAIPFAHTTTHIVNTIICIHVYCTSMLVYTHAHVTHCQDV